MEPSLDLTVEGIFLDESIKSAAKPLFLRIWRLCDRRPGTLYGISTGQLASISGLSPRAVGYRLGLLREAGLIELETIAPDKFVLSITDRVFGLSKEVVEKPVLKPTKPTPLFDGLDDGLEAASETSPSVPEVRPEVRDELRAEFAEAKTPSNITRTQARGFLQKKKERKFLNLEVASGKEEVGESVDVAEERNAALVREELDFKSPEVASVRREVAWLLRDAIADRLAPDVIDRVTFGVVRGLAGFSLDAVRRAAREANSEAERYDNQFLPGGVRHRWESINSFFRYAWEAQDGDGWVWPSVRRGIEPAPERPKSVSPIADTLAGNETDSAEVIERELIGYGLAGGTAMAATVDEILAETHESTRRRLDVDRTKATIIRMACKAWREASLVET